MATTVAESTSRPSRAAAARTSHSPQTSAHRPTSTTKTSSSGLSLSAEPPLNSNAGSSGYGDDSWQTSSVSTLTSLSRLRESLPENPHIYDFSEVRAATNNFLAKRYSSSSSTACWRGSLRGRDVIVFQRKLRREIETARLRERLSVICRSHHVSLIKLLGVSISGGQIYLVYDFVNGANLADCLRNPRNPDFTVLSTWISRMQIATDLAHGLDYIHNSTGLNMSLVHNHIRSSSIIVAEPSFNGRICHFGTAELCGEATADRPETESPPTTPPKTGSDISEIIEEPSRSLKPDKMYRSDSGLMQFEGVTGYMPPEFRSSGVATQKSDVYAFGAVLLELLSGQEPLKIRFDKERGDFVRTSVIDTARAVVDGGDGDDGWRRTNDEGRLRTWVDRRLKDSFPVEVAEKVTRLALECVHVDPNRRPSMRRVADKISKLYLESRVWSDNVKQPTGISLSLAPR